MKKHLLSLLFAGIAISAQAQDSIPNGNFEAWKSFSYEDPMYYPYTSNLDAFEGSYSFNVQKTSDAYHGQSALQLSSIFTIWGSTMAYLVNTPPRNGDYNSWTNGMVYNQKPTGIRGYYKYNVATADSGLIIAVFRKAGNNIGTYKYKLGGIKNTYTPFNFTFSPALAETPDSVVFGAASSDFLLYKDGVPGSILKLDSVSFTGVGSQPALMNGDFEVWQQNQTPELPTHWKYTGSGVGKTTDASAGKYALQLTTYASEENNIPKAEPGYVTNGFYNTTCDCMKGGKPFSNQKDTLTFWYKYSPTFGDIAQISLYFRKNGSGFNFIQKDLTAAASYQYVEVPFDLGQKPDTVVVQILSSLWDHRVVSFAGSVLKIDNVMFKSQLHTRTVNPLADAEFSIAPNCSDGKYQIRNAGSIPYNFDIFSPTGARISPTINFSNEIDLTQAPNGIYLVRIYTGDKVYVKRIVKR